MNIKQVLGKKQLFFDGGMGTMIQRLAPGAQELPEELNLTRPQTIQDIHAQYLDAGANVITANTFGAYSIKYQNLEEIIAAAIENAKAARMATGCRDAYIALDLGPTGKLLKPLGDLSFEACYEIFKASAILGEKYGADLAVIETISDTYEAKAAILAVKENTSLPVFCTFTFDEAGRTLTGGDVPTMVALLEGLGVDALGINCGLGPKQMETLMPALLQYASLPLLVQPNAGLPKIVDGRTCYDLTVEEFAQTMASFCRQGVHLLGGCCGTTPEHIAEMVQRCRGISPQAPVPKDLTLISSYGKALVIGREPVLIGERINPTGKKKLSQALQDQDMDYLIEEALSQKEAGAHILDVNVGLPGIDEQALMCQAVEQLQEMVSLPLQIDSSFPEVIEKALRLYNGKALVNSVNGKKESMEAIFPLIKKYGGVVIGLTLDEDGIPPTAEGRYAVAEKIIRTAASYGIDRKNILIDPLVLTAGAQQKESWETLKALTQIKKGLGVRTLLGVTNISFGLPNRDLVNTTFFAMALQAGPDACILNPLSKPMMDVFHTYRLLAGYDEDGRHYLETYNPDNNSQPSGKEGRDDLFDCIVNGLKEGAYEAAKAQLSIRPALEIINESIVPALDSVGERHETGHFFLPQLIISTEAAKRAFDALREETDKTGVVQATKGKVLLATVEGDIHDIGKNIVAALLSNYGYEVIDLGKDVKPETVVTAIQKENAALVGLSALMTTTVTNMEATVGQLKKACPACKVMVGGAVLNEEYAKKIGADYYGKDALAAVSIAGEVFR